MKKWTDEKIEEGIMVIANKFSPVRMPTDKETVEMSDIPGLSNAIQRSGGYAYWANRLNLDQKYSETKIGVKYEHLIGKMLEAKGHKVVYTPTKHPYDLLVDGCVKVDVKVANESQVRGYPIHAYRTSKKLQTCDFYICCENDKDKNIYVIPACVCSGQSQIEMGIESRKYQIYKEAFHLIDRTVRFYEDLLVKGAEDE